MLQAQWWGDFNVVQGQARSWTIGERAIVIERKASEWNSWNIETPEEVWEPLVCGVLDTQALQGAALEEADTFAHQEGLLDSAKYCDIRRVHLKCLMRHLQAPTTGELHIAPALADRSIVVRLSSPVRLLAGEQARIYVSTPLWFQASAMPGHLMMLDTPFWQPSDSWFGANTRDGEFCYAKYTDARLQLDLLTPRAHRAITPILVNNKRDAPLDIERLNIPVPLLSLYSDCNHQLWTQLLTVTRDEGGELAELLLAKQAPEEAKEATQIAEPRIKIEKHAFTRALSSLFA